MVSLPAPSFGTLLRRFRESTHLTQTELAERAGLSREGISALERNTSRVPRRDTVELLADALGLSAADRALFASAARDSRASSSWPLPSSSQPSVRPFPYPLVGRAGELDLVRHHLGDEGTPVLALAGEPGIGKTRLLREAVLLARESGWTVMESGCLRAEGQEPYAPVLAALERYVRVRPPALLRDELRGCSWLVRLLPELADASLVPTPVGTLAAAQERRLIFAAVGRFLANASGTAGTLMVLDDLQWADRDAFDLLTALVRSESERPLRVLGAYRSTEVHGAHPVAATLTALSRDGLAELATVGPLAAEEALQLLQALSAELGAMDADLKERILQRTAGVPFYLVSYARALKVNATLVAVQDDVPWDLAESIRQRVAALPVAAQRLLSLAAVIGRTIPSRLLLDTAGLPEPEMLDALSATCRARLLLEDSEDAYRFPHDIVREVVEADLGSARRRALHRRVAEALEERPEETAVERLAYHYGRAGVYEKACVYLEQAGDRAQALSAHTEAERYYRELVARLDALGRKPEATAAREKLGGVLNALGRYDDALIPLEQAEQAFRALGRTEDVLRIAAQIGQIHAYLGTPQAGLIHVRQVVFSEGQRSPSPGLAMLYVALAHLCFACGQYEEQLAAAEHAADLARAVGDLGTQAEAELRRGTALQMLGRLRAGTVALEAALAPAEAAGNLATTTIVLNNLGAAYADLGELPLARAYTDRSLQLVEQMGNPARIAHQLERRGTLAFYAGEWSQARCDYEQAVTIVRGIVQARTSIYPMLDLGRLSASEGRQTEASQYLDGALALAERSDDLQALCSVHALLAELDLLAGAPDRARARLEPLVERSGERHLFLMRVMPRLAWARSDLGDEPGAQVALERCLAWASAEQMRLVLVDALRIHAMLLIRQRRWDQAQSTLDRTLTLCRAMPYPYAEAKALHVYGEMLAARGESLAARDHFTEALSILNRLGERLYGKRAERALCELERPK